MFRTKAVRYFLMTYLSILLIWETFVAMALADISKIVPLGLIYFIIALILIEHEWTRLVLRAWVIIFVLINQAIKIGSKLLASASGELEYITSFTFFLGIFQFCMGLVILYISRVFIRDIS